MKSSPKTITQQKEEATEVIELASEQIESLARAFELIATMLEAKGEQQQSDEMDSARTESAVVSDEIPSMNSGAELLIH